MITGYKYIRLTTGMQQISYQRTGQAKNKEQRPNLFSIAPPSFLFYVGDP
jgi:hypothetical protein